MKIKPSKQMLTQAAKRQLIKHYQRIGGYTVFVEKVPCSGSLIGASEHDFRQTIALHSHTSASDSCRLQSSSSCSAVHSTGQPQLNGMLHSVQAPAIMWIDAQLLKGGSGRNVQHHPLIRDLRAVSELPVKDHLLLIDHASLLNDADHFPSLSAIDAALTSFGLPMVLSVENDILRIADASLTATLEGTIADPSELLTYKRFDIAAKLFYAEMKEQGMDSSWPEEVYLQHLKVWNNYNENPQFTGQDKSHSDRFIDDFDALLQDVKTEGFDAERSRVWVNERKELVNGAHRTAAAILYRSPIAFEMVPSFMGQEECTAEYFKNKRNFVPEGLREEYRDEMARTYIRYKKNTRIVIVYPRAAGKNEEIEQVLSGYCDIVCRKEIRYTYHGLFNLVKVLYDKEPWIGDFRNRFEGVQAKTDTCYAERGTTRIFLVDLHNGADMVAAKERVRSLFGIDKHSIHINDHHHQTVDIARYLFNNNSIDMFNRIDLRRTEQFMPALQQLRSMMQSRQWSDENCAADAAVSEALLEYRTPSEVQLQHRNGRCTDELCDPRNYFFYDGMKFRMPERVTTAPEDVPSGINTADDAFTLCRNTAGLGVLVVWPVSQTKNLEPVIAESLQQVAQIRQRVTVRLSKNGVTNLLRYIHYGKIWWEEHLLSEVEKRCPEGDRQYEISVYIFQAKDINSIRGWKNAVRDRLGLNKSSFHITDPDCPAHIGKKCSCSVTEQELYVETLKHAQLLFNENSVHFLNHSNPAQFPNFVRYFEQFAQWVERQSINVDRLCIDNGGTLAVYGIRDVHDLDFLYRGEMVRTGIPNVDCHNKQFAQLAKQKEIGFSVEEIIDDPKNHFYWMGFKVAAFHVTRKIKQFRTVSGTRRHKDSKDFYLMNVLENRMKNRGKKLILTTDGGLGNRLRTVAIYKTIAAFLGRDFYLYWPPNAREYNTGFNELFKSPLSLTQQEYELAVSDPTSRYVEIEYGVSPNSRFGGRGGMDPLYAKDAHKVNELIAFTEETLVVNTLVKFHPDFIEPALFDALVSDTLSQLVPTDDILNITRSFEERRFRHPMIGLHIRRTDREECSINSPDRLFIDLIRKYLQHDASTHFYLATDSKTTEAVLKEQFGEAIITIDKKYDMPNWQRPTSTKESLIEMILLSKTSKVYGSYSSSFGSIAAKMGKIPFDEVTVNHPVDLTPEVLTSLIEQTRQSVSNADAERTVMLFRMLAGYPETQRIGPVDLRRAASDVQYAEIMLKQYGDLSVKGKSGGTVPKNSAQKGNAPSAPIPVLSAAALPKVSVVIPCYNQAQYLTEAVESVVAQTFTDWELVIVNDGSTDSTSDVARQLIARYPGRRIVLTEKKNGGLSDARNWGIERANGMYILPFDADDLLHPAMLSSVLAEATKSGCDIIYTDQEYFEAEQKIVRTLDFDRNILFGQNYFAYCSFFKKAMWKSVGGYKRSMKWGYEDWEFWISCAEAGFTFRRLPEVLFKYRVKKNSMLTAAREHDQELKAQIILHHPSIYAPEALESARRLIGDGLLTETAVPKQKEPAAAERPFTVTAIISAFNEADVIRHVIGDLIANGVSVYLLDNNSSDATIQEASHWLGKGLLHIERFPDDCGYSKRNKKEYVWRDILRRKQELAQSLQADWFIHADADEFRESPFAGQTLTEGLKTVDAAGFNAVNFELLNFRPVNNDFVPGTDVRTALTHYEKGEWFDSAQIKAWKNTGVAVDLVSTGGHSVGFAQRKVYPVPFILRHYPIRSEQHGRLKVYQERLARFAKEERDAGWHVQYDELIQSKRSFLSEPSVLVRYDGNAFRMELLRRAKKRIALYQSPHAKEIIELENALVNVPYDLNILRRLSALYRSYDAGEFALVLLKRILEVLPEDTEAQQGVEAIVLGAKKRPLSPSASAERKSVRTSVIIPVYNKVELTAACIKALYKNTPQDSFELIMVDNASTDGTKQFLQKLRTERNNVTVIRNESNLGFSKANNIGARAANGTHLLFLNNDTEPTEGWLQRLHDVFREEQNVGVVGAKLLYPNRTIQHAGIEFLPLQRPLTFNGTGPVSAVPDHPYRNQPEHFAAADVRRSLDMVTGACLLIDAQLFASVGGFNESYLNGCEDIDLCLKVRNRGLQVVYQPKAVVIHHEGQSEGRFTHVRRNLEQFFRTWGKRFDASGKFVPKNHSDADPSEPTIVWEGAQYVKHSLALINREMCMRLAKDNYDLSLIPYGKDSYAPSVNDPESVLQQYIGKETGEADIHVRLQWPPNLNAPPTGRWVINQPWEFGILPKEWVNVFSRSVDEMWVISSYVRDVYVNSGIPADRVFVVPCGIDPAVFHTAAKPYRLRTKKSFRFLFVGGTILRKGIDILLDAYTQSFTASDDVCLVIKDMGGDSFYKGMNCKEKIAAIAKTNNAPAIEYIDAVMSDNEVAGLYTACNALVHPYRGEGFGLPILESMACGTPAIVTNGGACLDFCSAGNSMLIHAQRVTYTDNRIGEYVMEKSPWLLEPSLDHLKQLMQYAVQHPEELKAMGLRASSDAHRSWTWDAAYAVLKRRIAHLAAAPVRRFTKEAPAGEEALQRSINTLHRLVEEEKTGEALLLAEQTIVIAENIMDLQNKERILADLNNVRRLLQQSTAPESDPMLETAERLLSEEKTEEAVILLNSMLEKDPHNIHVLNDLGVASIMLKKYHEAAGYLRNVIVTDPSNETAIGNLQYLEQLLSGVSDEKIIQEAESFIIAGETEKARLLLNELLAVHPEHIDALNDLSVVEIMEKNWREAAIVINKVVTLDPSNESAKQNLQYIDQVVSGGPGTEKQ